jgi:hypothetical protein
MLEGELVECRLGRCLGAHRLLLRDVGSVSLRSDGPDIEGCACDCESEQRYDGERERAMSTCPVREHREKRVVASGDAST